jgi:hypothetical protein
MMERYDSIMHGSHHGGGGQPSEMDTSSNDIDAFLALTFDVLKLQGT